MRCGLLGEARACLLGLPQGDIGLDQGSRLDQGRAPIVVEVRTTRRLEPGRPPAGNPIVVAGDHPESAGALESGQEAPEGRLCEPGDRHQVRHAHTSKHVDKFADPLLPFLAPARTLQLGNAQRRMQRVEPDTAALELVLQGRNGGRMCHSFSSIFR
jgi:hypothetical protein